MAHVETVEVARAGLNDASSDAFGISFFRDTGYDAMRIEFSDCCPLCNMAFRMGGINLQKSVHSFMGLEDAKGEVLCVHRCPSCRRLFVTKHVRVNRSRPMKQVSMWPEPQPKMFDYIDGLSGLSPRFVELYQAALRIEALAMMDIVGNVYRMALECLVKDYALYKHPDDEVKILKMRLYDAINTYFNTQPRIQNLGHAVRLLGNDYTHYVSKIDMSSLTEMKYLLEVVAMTVHNEILVNALQPIADKHTNRDNM